MSQGKKLIDGMKELFSLKYDATLARGIGVKPQFISKIRSGSLPIGDSLLIKIQRTFKMTLPEVEALYIEVEDENI